MIGARLRRSGDRADSGTTLVEMIIAAAMTVVLGLLAATVSVQLFRSTSKAVNDFNQTSSGSITLDRLTFELRQARLVYSDSTATKLHFWVDFNGDNQQDLGERITYTLANNGSGGYVLQRYSDATGATTTTVDQGVANLPTVFNYFTDSGSALTPSSISLSNPVGAVQILLTQTGSAGTGGVKARDTTTEVRLRNASSS